MVDNSILLRNGNNPKGKRIVEPEANAGICIGKYRPGGMAFFHFATKSEGIGKINVAVKHDDISYVAQKVIRIY